MRATTSLMTDKPSAFDRDAVITESFEEVSTRLAETIRSLESAGIRVSPGSRYREYLKQFAAMATTDRSNPVVKVDLGVWHRSLAEVSDLVLICGTLLDVPLIPGVATSLEHMLSGPVRRGLEKKHSRARDVQFELVIASLLKRVGYSIELAEPDIVITSGRTRFGVAAKRPRSNKKVESIVRDADRQIARSGLQGVIALDLSCTANPGDNHFNTADFATAFERVKRLADAFIHENGQRLRSRVNPFRSFGLVVHVGVPVFDLMALRLAHVRRWAITNFCDLSDPRAEMLHTLTADIAAAEANGRSWKPTLTKENSARSTCRKPQSELQPPRR